jgi:hypothetical protein
VHSRGCGQQPPPKSEVGLDNASQLKKRLRNVGLSNAAINAAWPTWWSDAADASTSAQTELRFSIGRKLGIDPHSLLEDNEQPRFIWRDEAKFKHLSGEDVLEQSAITSFGTAVGRLLVAATSTQIVFPQFNAAELRGAILRQQQYIRLVDLLSLCWSVGVPVIHLRVFPLRHKRMAAMSVRIDGRNAILIGRDSLYPPQVAFHLAHELAHIALGHLTEDPVIVDLESSSLASSGDDPDEIAADQFALELLTGFREPKILSKSKTFNSAQLAQAVLSASPELRIEPGTLALCFGYSTGSWGKTNAAIRRVYSSARPVWSEINRVAAEQLNFDLIPEDSRPFLRAALGESSAT